MTSRRQDFLSTAVEQLRYHVQKLESAATHMMAACDLCHAQIEMRVKEFRDVTLASVDGQKVKAYIVILSASGIFFKKLLVNNLNHHPLIFMRKIEDKGQLLH